MGTGDGVTSPARFSCSMSNAVGNCCRMLFACRTGAFLEQTDGVGLLFRSEKIIAFMQFYLARLLRGYYFQFGVITLIL